MREALGLLLSTKSKQTREHTPIILVLERWRQENQIFKVIV